MLAKGGRVQKCRTAYLTFDSCSWSYVHQIRKIVENLRIAKKSLQVHMVKVRFLCPETASERNIEM